MAETAIPVVDPEDLQRVYELFAKYPNHGIGARLLTRHCKPGEDVQVLCQRTYLLTILATAPDDIRKRLSPWLNEEGVWSAGLFAWPQGFRWTGISGACFTPKNWTRS